MPEIIWKEYEILGSAMEDAFLSHKPEDRNSCGGYIGDVENMEDAMNKVKKHEKDWHNAQKS